MYVYACVSVHTYICVTHLWEFVKGGSHHMELELKASVSYPT